jgi:hypothetical protein
LAGIGAPTQALASRRDRGRYPPPGEHIDVDGHRLHLHVIGEQGSSPSAYLARPQGWSVAADTLHAWRRLSRQQITATRSLGDLPLAVLSVTEQDRYAEVLTRLQAELATLSSNCPHVTVEGATHYTRSSPNKHTLRS